MSTPNERIEQYKLQLGILSHIMFDDDSDWKDQIEIILKMLVEDRIEVLKRKDELTHKGSDEPPFISYIRESDS